MKYVVIFTENGSTNYRWHYSLQGALQEKLILQNRAGVSVVRVFKLTEVN